MTEDRTKSPEPARQNSLTGQPERPMGHEPTELAQGFETDPPGSLSWPDEGPKATSQSPIRMPKNQGMESSGLNILGSLLADRYKIKDRLGSGGMGIVYRAEHVALHKDVAVKVLLPELSSIRSVAERFEREALSLSRLDHPGIVRVIDFGSTDQGLLYLVMDFVEGEPLSDIIRREAPFTAERAVSLCLQILLALDHAHGIGVVHRDLKPDNIMIVDPGTRSESIRILDFGIAKMLEESNQDTEPLTQAGMVFGTPEYVSPEQAAGEPDKVDMRSDLYTVGVILYEMLSGRRPFEATSRMALLNQHMTKKPPPLAVDRPDRVIPKGLADIVMKALAKNRRDRFQSALEFYSALVHLPMDRRPLSLWPGAIPPVESLPSVHMKRPGGKKRLWLVAAMVLLLLAGLGWLWATRWRQRHTEPPAKTNVRDVDSLLAELTPEQRKALIPVRKALVGVKPSRAIRLLTPMVEKQPSSAPLWYLLARAYGMLHTKKGGLKMLDSYRKALDLDPKLGKRPRFKQDLILALNSKYRAVRQAAVELIDTHIGKEARDVITQVSQTHNSYRLIRDLLVVADKYGIADAVDRVRLYKKMLNDSPKCAERAEAVRELMLTKDPSLLPFLRRALNRKPWKDGGRTISNKCIADVLRQAIASLEQESKKQK